MFFMLYGPIGVGRVKHNLSEQARPQDASSNTHLKKYKPATEWSCAPLHLLMGYQRSCRHDRHAGRGSCRHKHSLSNGADSEMSKSPILNDPWHEQPMRVDPGFWATGHHTGPTKAPCERATPNGRPMPSLHVVRRARDRLLNRDGLLIPSRENQELKKRCFFMIFVFLCRNLGV